MACARRHGRGFTLTELLIVIAIVALVATMAIPTLSRSAAGARSIKCQKNLSSIGQAYATFITRQELLSTNEIFAANTWRTALVPMMGNQRSVYFCPEDEEQEFTLPISSIRIYNGGSFLYEVQLFDTHPYWLEGNHNDFLPDKPAMWRVNDEVYNSGALDRYNMPAYTPGNNPEVSWWIIEVQRYGDDYQYATGDQDFNDLNIRLTDLGGGVFDVEGFHGDAGYNFGIVDGDGVETRESGGVIGPLEMEGEGGSYGVNWMASKFHRGQSKLLSMDFPKEVVYAGSRLQSVSSNWEELEVRHLGKVNYVMTDGSVHTARPDEIDPADPSNDRDLWTVSDR